MTISNNLVTSIDNARKPAAQQARPDGRFLWPAPNRFLAAARRVKRADLDSGLSAKEAFLKSPITYRQSLQFTEIHPTFPMHFFERGLKHFRNFRAGL
jgi:hypothetical protein